MEFGIRLDVSDEGIFRRIDDWSGDDPMICKISLPYNHCRLKGSDLFGFVSRLFQPFLRLDE
jgi:hypothetical protein